MLQESSRHRVTRILLYIFNRCRNVTHQRPNVAPSEYSSCLVCWNSVESMQRCLRWEWKGQLFRDLSSCNPEICQVTLQFSQSLHALIRFTIRFMFRLQVWIALESGRDLYLNISGGFTLELSCPTRTAECPWDCDCPTRHQRGSTEALWCIYLLMSLIYWIDSIWLSWFIEYGCVAYALHMHCICGCDAAPLCCPLVSYWWTWKTVIWRVTWYDLVPSRPSLRPWQPKFSLACDS